MHAVSVVCHASAGGCQALLTSSRLDRMSKGNRMICACTWQDITEITESGLNTVCVYVKHVKAVCLHDNTYYVIFNVVLVQISPMLCGFTD